MTTRRDLTPQEQETVRIQIQNIRPDMLKPDQLKFFQSVCSQYSYDSRLSDKQLTALKNLKYSSDMAIRDEAIRRGRLRLHSGNAMQIDRKLNTVYNKIGR